MADGIQWSDNHMEKSDDAHLGIMFLENVAKARASHKSFPQYAVTPLARLDNLAARLGLNSLCVKDESYRFGLNAFKVLGGSFAMASYIAGETGRDVADMTYGYLTSDELARDFGQAAFFTAALAKNFNEIPESLSGLDYSGMYNDDFLHTWDKTTDELKALYETAAARVEIAGAALRRRGAWSSLFGRVSLGVAKGEGIRWHRKGFETSAWAA